MALKLNGTNSVAAPAYAGADADTGLQCGTDEVNLVTGGTARLKIESDGDVGIGTTSPASRLHVYHPTVNVNALIESGDANAYIAFKDSSTSSASHVYLGASGNDMQFATGTVERMRIDSSGNVGIGTTSPSRSLTVTSSTGATNILGVFDNSATTAVNCVIAFSDPTSTQGQFSTRLGSVGDGLAFYTNGANERMRIDSAGRVGIGASNAGSYNSDANDLVVASTGNMGLTLASTDSGNSNIHFADGTSGNESYRGIIAYLHSTDTMNFWTGGASRMYLDSSGRLLLGTTTEGQANADNLTINDSGNCGLTIRSGTNNAGAIYFSDATSGGGEYDGFITYNQPSRFMQFGLGQAERMRVDISGRLLIGTSTSPSAGSGQYAKIVSTGNTSTPAGDGRLMLGRGLAATSMSSGQDIGSVLFTDNTGATFAAISSNVDGTPGSGDYPARLGFATTSDGASSPTERMRIDSSGHVGVGRTPFTGAPGYMMQLRGPGTQTFLHCSTSSHGDSYDDGMIVGSDNTAAYIVQRETYPLKFYTSNTERMRLNSDGSFRVSTDTSLGSIYSSTETIHAFENDDGNNVCLYLQHSNNSTPYGLFIHFNRAAPDNNSQYFITGQDSSAVRIRIWSDGDIDNHDNSYGSLSDVKLKQDIVDAGSQWEDLKNLRVRKFKFKSDVAAYGDEAKTLIGLVAQEAETVSPGLVKDNPDLDENGNDLGTTTKAVRYSVLYMKAIKALQEAQTRIETLETQHADLLARVTALEAA